MNKIFIDVTRIEPRLKHPAIFEAFDKLLDGEAVLLHNDHDPKPLYYQLLGERGDCFTWEYVLKGPLVWEVEIGRKSAGSEDETVGSIAAKDIRKASVFKDLGIDFCCGGKKTLAAACAEKGLDVLDVREKLSQTALAKSPAQHNYEEWTLSFLSDYIVNVHHAYIRKAMPDLRELTCKVADHHGKTNPELNTIRDRVDEAISELNVHMKKEEQILFPYIRQMENNVAGGGSWPAGFKSVMQPISVMEHDHDIVGDLFSEIRALSSNYTPPAEACNSYGLIYRKLEEFEDDLHMHIHLENNVLFPKAVALEQQD